MKRITRDQESKGAENANVAMWQEMYGEWMDRAAKHAKLAVDAGIAERQVRLIEQQGQFIAQAISPILDSLVLTSEQKRRAPELVRSALLAIDAQSSVMR